MGRNGEEKGKGECNLNVFYEKIFSIKEKVLSGIENKKN